MNDPIRDAGPVRAARPPDDRIMVHVFLTADYLAWAELFLESFRRHHGERIHVRVDGRDLGADDVALLRDVYTNMEIHNETIDRARLAEALGVDAETLDAWRRQVSRGMLTDRNRHLKMFFTVTQRYRSMAAVLRRARDDGYDLVLHSDADMYVRGSLDPFFRIAASHDVSMYLRPWRETHAYKVLGAFIGFNLTGGGTDRFLDVWMERIDRVNPPDRWKGFGQSAIWFALEDTDGLSVGDLSTLPDAPRYSKTFEDAAALWLGNSSRLGSHKAISLDRSWNDYRKRLPRVPRMRASPRETLEILWGHRPRFGLGLHERLRRLSGAPSGRRDEAAARASGKRESGVSAPRPPLNSLE